MEKILAVLEKEGFSLIAKDVSASFGDYYYLFSKDSIDLRLSSSKSFLSFDIRLSNSQEEWFDLALVKALLYHEKKLNSPFELDDCLSLLTSDMERIVALFGKDYYETKNALRELVNERLKQLFPNINNA